MLENTLPEVLCKKKKSLEHSPTVRTETNHYKWHRTLFCIIMGAEKLQKTLNYVFIFMLQKGELRYHSCQRSRSMKSGYIPSKSVKRICYKNVVFMKEWGNILKMLTNKAKQMAYKYIYLTNIFNMYEHKYINFRYPLKRQGLSGWIINTCVCT